MTGRPNSHLFPMRVSFHALEQWRLRAAVYGDETEVHVRAAVMRAVLVDKDEILPFPRGRDSI